jgi:predicted dithiol-disulfide oxidoreductase (DUF899 family)
VPEITESDAYDRARAELREAEIALRAQRIHTAALRRRLPLDTEVEDYLLEEGPADLAEDEPVRPVRLSELFTAPGRSLIVYQFMYGEAQTKPCASCSMWIDGFNGVARHVVQRADFTVVAQAPIGDVRAWARHRGWHGLRLLSSAPSSFKRDLKMQGENGEQHPGLTVFTRADDGTLRHFYSGGAQLADGIREGGLDQFSPVWNLFDLVPEGGGDWYPSLEYAGAQALAAR